MRDSSSITEAFKTIEEQFGPVEVLIANAGITRDTLLLRMKEEDFTDVIDTNLTGSFRVVQRAIKGMLKIKRGRIILVSSVVGLYGSPGQVNYSSSKAALVGMHVPSPASWAGVISLRTWSPPDLLIPQ